LPITDVTAQTLAPAGVYSAPPAGFKVTDLTLFPNPKSVLNIRVQNASPSNTSDYPLMINNLIAVTTSDLLATNGVIQVVAGVVSPAILQ
jgi:hypothetical protein